MSSSSGRTLALLFLLLAPLAGACGKKGDPTPPPRRIPQATTDLTIRQRGQEVALEFAYPKATVAGLPYAGLDEISVLALSRPLPEQGSPAPVDAREFAVAAKPFLKLAGGELASAISGDRVTVRFRLSEPSTTPTAALFYGVQTHAVDGESSALSNLVLLVPRPAPEPPADFVVAARKGGVELSWSGTTAPAAGYRVYRRDAERTAYGPALATLEPSVTRHLDTTAAYGRRYIYTLCAVASRDPLVESAPAAEREIDYEDRFAPEPPRGLRALASVGEVRLVWEASADADTAGYVVERADPDADFHRVNADPVAAREFVDQGLASGYTFRYRVAAIDGKGNLGIASAPVDVLVP